MFKKLLFICCLFFSFQQFSQEGKLSKAKESLKNKSTTTSSSSSNTDSKKSRRNNRNNNEDRTFMQFLVVDVFGRLILYTTYGVAIESPLEYNGRMHHAEIAHYPYEIASHGNFIYTDSINFNMTRFDIYNRFLFENKNLYGNNLGLDFRFLKRFAFNVDFTTFAEKIDTRKEFFTMYSFLLKYHRIRLQKFDAWFGIGATHVANDVNETGFTFGFGGELFIKKPISLLFSHKTTSVNLETINNTKLLIKYHIKHVRISSGYEHYKLGISKINAFSLGAEISF